MTTRASIKNLYQSCASTTGWGTLTATGDYPYITNDWKELTGYTIDPKYYEYISDDIYVGKPSSQEDIKKALDWYKTATETDFNKNKKGDDDMRCLYEVILVNPKTEAFLSVQIIARSETSALMKAYDKTDMFDAIDFDDLKTSCRVLMEWKKKESLKKAIETIKKAAE